MGAGVEVLVRRGELVLRFLTPVPLLYRGFVLHPRDAEDPYAFQIDFSDFGLDTFPVVFSRDRGTTAVHFDAMPVSAWKRPEATNPRRWAEGAAPSSVRRSSAAGLGGLGTGAGPERASPPARPRDLAMSFRGDRGQTR